MERSTPIPDSYWVVPGKLLAGEYPGAVHGDQALEKTGKFLAAGVTHFIDLTEAFELEPYAAVVAAQASALGIEVGYDRFPVRDLGVVSVAETRVILDRIDAMIEAGRTVYVHCWGGIGRTGTVVGCWLVRHGQGAEEALETIRRLRAPTPKGRRASPEMPAQFARVREWAPGT